MHLNREIFIINMPKLHITPKPQQRANQSDKCPKTQINQNWAKNSTSQIWLFNKVNASDKTHLNHFMHKHNQMHI